MDVRAVLFDFYGTLAESFDWGPSWVDLLDELGYELSDDVRDRWWNDGLDGTEHDEHSHSRDHYVAWQHARTRAMLAESGVPEADALRLIERVREIGAHRRIEAFDDALEVLAALRDRDLVVALCSNWDWDLHEAVEAAGLHGRFDVVVSSAWVGARKPHPRIYAHTLTEVGVDPEEALFVGDSWGPDVEGPRAAGMTPVYLVRDHRSPHPDAHGDTEVTRISDLRALLDLL